MAQMIRFLSPPRETWIELLAPGFGLVQPQLLQAFGEVSQWLGAMSLSVSLLICLSEITN